ncbi:MAG: hypothetical protein WBB28_25670 [Crinalium sp.]
MTKFPYDQFSKEYLQELLTPLGQVETSREVPGETRYVDVLFTPAPQPQADPQMLGLLGQITSHPCLLEPFRMAVRPSEVRSCLSKLFDVFAKLENQAQRNKTRISEVNLPFLWILSPTASTTLLDGFNARLDLENWQPGIYFLGDYLKTAIVAIHQLPRTEETLWLRLLGKGRVQEQAIDELEALPTNHPQRDTVLELLRSLRAILETSSDLEQEDRNLIMRLSAVYEQRLAEATQQGIQQGVREERRAMIENFLKARFGSLDEQLAAIIQPLLELSPEEFTSLLLQLSREELLDRFRG